MANPNISLLGATYNAVSGVQLPTSGGGTATFPFVEGSQTITTNNTYDVTNLAQVVVNVSGGGGGMNIQACIGMDTKAVTSYTATTLTLKVAQSGKYTVSWTGSRTSTSGTNGSRLYINSTAQTAYTTFDSTNTRIQHVEMTNVSLSANDTITVYCRSRSTSYYMTVSNLIIVQTS